MTPMKIHVNRIPFEGMREDVEYNPAEMDIARFDVKPEAVSLSSFVTKAGSDEVVVDADVQGKLTLSCARCLEPFPAPLRAHAVLSYHVKPTDVLDITDDIRQEIMLAYPMVPVCRPDCKGLCKICGQNLNNASCPHQLTT